MSRYCAQRSLLSQAQAMESYYANTYSRHPRDPPPAWPSCPICRMACGPLAHLAKLYFNDS